MIATMRIIIVTIILMMVKIMTIRLRIRVIRILAIITYLITKHHQRLTISQDNIPNVHF